MAPQMTINKLQAHQVGYKDLEETLILILHEFLPANLC